MMFVQIFSYIDFDLSEQKEYSFKLNGKDAAYTDILIMEILLIFIGKNKKGLKGYE